MQYKNPIIPGFHPDPSICRVGDDYYLVTSSFEYFPAIPLFHSKNLTDWEQIGHCITQSSWLPLPSGTPNSTGTYAPTIRHHNGRFYVICTNVAPAGETAKTGNFIVSAADPRGTWSEPVWLDCPGIDPSLFFDDSGKVHYTGTSGGIYICEINPDTGERLTGQKPLWNGTGGACPEGPHIYKRDDWYYLMVAEGGTEYGHMETIARSRSINGPYAACPHNPILSNRSLGAAIMATGHADFVEDQNGSWWAVCLGVRPICYPPKYNLGRETFLVPVEWTADGWPVLGSGGVVAPVVESNRPVLQMQENTYDTTIRRMPKAGEAFNFYEEFSGASLHPRWTYLYNPVTDHISTGSGLQLLGMAAGLSDAETSAFLGFRQMHHACTTQAKLVFCPAAGEEAGITIYLNRDHHYELTLAGTENGPHLLFRRRIGTLWKVEQEIPYAETAVYLELQATKELYVFRYSRDGESYAEIGSGEASYLTTETGGKFTGNFIAFYATGNGNACKNTAAVSFVRYTAGEE